MNSNSRNSPVVVLLLTILGFFLLTQPNCRASSIPLYSFNGSEHGFPSGNLTPGSDGNLYGATNGSIYKVTPAGVLSVLSTAVGNIHFANDGVQAPLILGRDGKVYGTTHTGIFAIAADGILTTVCTFSAPVGTQLGFTQGSDGNFYLAALDSIAGVILKITPDGLVTALHHFAGPPYPEGLGPTALIFGGDGNLYGTTYEGGTVSWAGTVFKLSTDGTFTTLYNFVPSNCSGAVPYSGAGCYANPNSLVWGLDGNLYGATDADSVAQSIVFRITLSGDFTILHVFDDVLFGSPIQLSDGNLYGTTFLGPGHVGRGQIYKLTSDGSYTVQYAFPTDDTGGGLPSGLVQGPNGDLYGTTFTGGAYHSGTVFSFTPPYEFSGFLAPIGGEVAASTGGSYLKPVKAFKFGSTIPIKFRLNFGQQPIITGIQTVRAQKYTSDTGYDAPIDGTPTGGATSGNQFLLTDAANGGWQFNLSTAGMSPGTWKLIANLSDGTTHEVWITIK